VVLRTIPGIDPYRVLLIATEVMPIECSRSPAHLVSHVGLAPRSSRSGLRPTRRGSLPAGANRWLRGAFVCAVVSHVAHAPESDLTRFYEQAKERLSWQVARSPRLGDFARAFHVMLRTEEVWRHESGNGERGQLHSAHVAETTPSG
jgi:hypothetical protein